LAHRQSRVQRVRQGIRSDFWRDLDTYFRILLRNCNDQCYLLGIPLIAAAMLRFEGQLYSFRRNDDAPTACYRCIFPEAPPPDMAPRCEEAGILGALAGVMGSLQTTEVLKELLGLGESLAGRMLIYDALATDFHAIKLPHDPNCALCGDTPTI